MPKREELDETRERVLFPFIFVWCVPLPPNLRSNEIYQNRISIESVGCTKRKRIFSSTTYIWLYPQSIHFPHDLPSTTTFILCFFFSFDSNRPRFGNTYTIFVIAFRAHKVEQRLDVYAIRIEHVHWIRHTKLETKKTKWSVITFNETKKNDEFIPWICTFRMFHLLCTQITLKFCLEYSLLFSDMLCIARQEEKKMWKMSEEAHTHTQTCGTEREEGNMYNVNGHEQCASCERHWYFLS